MNMMRASWLRPASTSARTDLPRLSGAWKAAGSMPWGSFDATRTNRPLSSMVSRSQILRLAISGRSRATKTSSGRGRGFGLSSQGSLAPVRGSTRSSSPSTNFFCSTMTPFSAASAWLAASARRVASLRRSASSIGRNALGTKRPLSRSSSTAQYSSSRTSSASSSSVGLSAALGRASCARSSSSTLRISLSSSATTRSSASWALA
mmetsp:Transcript_32043/g.106096  ORF Transcript_32043/g.106096 Transcript_32043/m.106096 type:complete len:206 (+) Transcript_32043:119-736(+)